MTKTSPPNTDSPVDLTDDWMNPRPSKQSKYEAPKASDPMRYLIERERVIQCFHYGRAPTHWDFWMSYDTKEKRDAAFARLRKEHPRWHLRTRDEHPYWDQLKARY